MTQITWTKCSERMPPDDLDYNGGVYLCEIINSANLTGDTLIELGEFVNRVNKVKDENNDNVI